MAVARTGEIEAQFWAKVDYDPHDIQRCWPWTDATRRGYGLFHFRDAYGTRVSLRPHRQAYILVFGEIPTYAESRTEIDHICHDPKVCQAGDDCQHRRCCNPWHMRLSNGLENSAPDRMVYWQTRKTHCPQGHEYDDINTARRPEGHRYCKTCNRNRVRALAAAKRAAS